MKGTQRIYTWHEYFRAVLIKKHFNVIGQEEKERFPDPIITIFPEVCTPFSLGLNSLLSILTTHSLAACPFLAQDNLFPSPLILLEKQCNFVFKYPAPSPLILLEKTQEIGESNLCLGP